MEMRKRFGNYLDGGSGPGKLRILLEWAMDTSRLTSMRPEGYDLFDRVVSILEQARANVVRSVYNNMVIALLAHRA
jgi:hypothetical protein